MLQIAYFIKVYNYLILNNFVLMTFYLHSLLNIEKCKSENIRRYQHIYTYIFIFQYMTKTEKRNKIFLNLQGKTFLRRFLILRYFRGSLKMVHPVKCQKFLWDSLKATYMENFIIVSELFYSLLIQLIFVLLKNLFWLPIGIFLSIHVKCFLFEPRIFYGIWKRSFRQSLNN